MNNGSSPEQNPFAPKDGGGADGRPDLTKPSRQSGDMPTPPPPSGYEAVPQTTTPYQYGPQDPQGSAAGQPGYGQPTYGQQPRAARFYGAPSSDAPSYGAPSYGAPPYGQPGGQTPYGQPAYGGYPPPPQPVYAPAGYGAPPTDGLAIASFVTSLVGLFGMAGAAGPVGLGLGIASLRKMKRTGAGGRGFAIAGIAIGAVGTLLILGIIALIVWAAIWSHSYSDDYEWSYNSTDVSTHVQLAPAQPLAA